MERLALEFLFVRVGPLGRMVFAQFGADIGLDRAQLKWAQQHRHVHKLGLDLARRVRLDRPRHVGRAFRRVIASTRRMLNAGLAARRDFRFLL
jgi:hypothetical protein